MKQSLRSVLTFFLLFMSLMRVVAQAPTSVSGRVLGYLSNRIGDYDGLRLQTATGEIRLFFPPHTAARIRQLAAVGQRIKADVEPGHGGPGHAKPVLDTPVGSAYTVDQPTVATYRLIRMRNVSSGTLRIRSHLSVDSYA